MTETVIVATPQTVRVGSSEAGLALTVTTGAAALTVSPSPVMPVTVTAPPREIPVTGPALQGPAGPPGTPGLSAAEALLLRPAAQSLGGDRVVYVTPAGEADYASTLIPESAAAVLGVTLGAVTAGAMASLQLLGAHSFAGWSWTPGAPLFLGENGLLTETPPTSGFVREVARAITASLIHVNPEPPIYLE